MCITVVPLKIYIERLYFSSTDEFQYCICVKQNIVYRLVNITKHSVNIGKFSFETQQLMSNYMVLYYTPYLLGESKKTMIILQRSRMAHFLAIFPFQHGKPTTQCIGE